jgi:hypothetical protein
MPFTKGQSGNPNGKPNGTPNKATRELRIILKNVIADELNNISEQLAMLPPKERVELLIKLLPYSLPRVYPESYQMGDGGQLDW